VVYPYEEMEYPLLDRELRNAGLEHRFYQKAILELGHHIAEHIAYNKNDVVSVAMTAPVAE
jgi:hypothetical protein